MLNSTVENARPSRMHPSQQVLRASVCLQAVISCLQSLNQRTLIGGHYFKERNGTEGFRHIIPRNGTIDAHAVQQSNDSKGTEIDVYFLFGSYHW